VASRLPSRESSPSPWSAFGLSQLVNEWSPPPRSSKSTWLPEPPKTSVREFVTHSGSETPNRLPHLDCGVALDTFVRV
jgi:hypothetical protein